jgi:hypothetical protein
MEEAKELELKKKRKSQHFDRMKLIEVVEK